MYNANEYWSKVRRAVHGKHRVIMILRLYEARQAWRDTTRHHRINVRTSDHVQHCGWEERVEGALRGFARSRWWGRDRTRLALDAGDSVDDVLDNKVLCGPGPYQDAAGRTRIRRSRDVEDSGHSVALGGPSVSLRYVRVDDRGKGVVRDDVVGIVVGVGAEVFRESITEPVL